MLEIILLIFLSRKIGAIATNKGLPPGRWKLYLVLAWIAGEFGGAITGAMIFGFDNMFSIILVALAGAFTAYVLLRSYLSKLPDVLSDEDIHNLGS
jgi:hypothetical protein